MATHVLPDNRMKAMILAAGRGERMRPLTDAVPKPLLNAGGKPLIDYHLNALASSGVNQVVVNVAWQKQRLLDHLGDGSRFGLRVDISDEGEAALETGGGVYRALKYLGQEAFWLVNGDVYAEPDFSAVELPAGMLAHLLMVPNPEHNPGGDFCLQDGLISNQGPVMFTYSGISILHPGLFRGCRDGVFPLAPLLSKAAAEGKVSGELLTSFWCDVGTPERLAWLDKKLASQQS